MWQAIAAALGATSTAPRGAHTHATAGEDALRATQGRANTTHKEICQEAQTRVSFSRVFAVLNSF